MVLILAAHVFKRASLPPVIKTLIMPETKRDPDTRNTAGQKTERALQQQSSSTKYKNANNEKGWGQKKLTSR